MMKKLLTCGLVLTLSVNAMAQQLSPGVGLSGFSATQKGQLVNGETKTTPSNNPKPAVGRKKTGIPSTQAVTVIDIGNSGNAFGTAFGAKTTLFAHPVVNCVSMVYRSSPTVTGDATSGFLRYGYSSDAGATWSANQGPIYSATAPLFNARYPQGMIYNAVGNTSPANAFVSYFAPSLAGLNVGWGGLVHGSSALTGGGTPTSTEDTSTSYLIPDGGALNTDDNSFWTSTGYIDAAGGYNGNILLAKGVWNAGDYSYTYNSVAAPFDLRDAGGAPQLTATSIAWGTGGTGYVALLGHESYTVDPDSFLYPTIFKTTDNGATWNKVAALDMFSFETFFQFDTSVTGYTAAFEIDMAVDANNNAHIFMAVGPQATSPFSINSGTGNWGVFDIFTTDGGTTWSAEALGLPLTFRGEFTDGTNNLAEDSRPQIARTLDGTKLFFVWFDTDTTLTPGLQDNVLPNAICRAFNVTTGLWTSEINLTAGSNADGACLFGNVSPFTLDGATAGCYKIPVSYLEVPINIGVDINHKYLDGLEVCDPAFTEASASFPVANYVTSSINENTVTTSFTLGQNFPNPFNGSTQFNLNLVKSSTVTVEVYSIVGKLLMTNTYDNLQTGLNTLSIDGSDLASGIYTYTVIVGSEKATRTMIVK
ncbi:MAG: T9SS type A sorting domain-containing protein [Bacteroidetes bacterium]|nr:T9SS type A sorting domain-containing protein [Bacteroidota bacterium]